MLMLSKLHEFSLHFSISYLFFLQLRLFVYTFFGTIIYGMYSVLTDGIRIRQDTKVDKSLAELGPGNEEIGILEEYANYLLMTKNDNILQKCAKPVFVFMRN